MKIKLCKSSKGTFQRNGYTSLNNDATDIPKMAQDIIYQIVGIKHIFFTSIFTYL